MLAFVGAALAVLLVSAASVGAFAVASIAGDVGPGVHLSHVNGDPTAPPPGIGAVEGEINVVLAGSDSGGGDVTTFGKRGENLNDVTMLLHVSADHQHATVVSFPRDMFVTTPSCVGDDGKTVGVRSGVKMNTILTYGGLPCIVATIEKYSGFSIPYAAVIQFQGVIAMSDAIGGVPVCVATAIHDEQIHFDLDAGQQTLSGMDALQFLRTRYGVGDGSDISRISNQQVYLSSLVRTLKQADTFSNPVKVYSIAKAATSNMTLSDTLTNVNTIASLALTLKDVQLDNIVFVQYPTAGGTVGGQNGVVPIQGAATTLFAALKAGQPVAITGGTGQYGSKPATDAPAAPGTTPAPTDTASAVPLPSSVHGQTASQQTCSRGQRAG